MLRERVITALVLAPLLLWVVVWAPSAVTVAVMAAVVLAGAWEWSQFCTRLLSLRIVYVGVMAQVLYLAWQFGATSNSGLTWVLTVALLWWLGAFGWLSLAPSYVNRFLAALVGILVLVPAFVALGKLHQASERGPLLVLFLLLLVFSADIGAYFSGRRFGKLKLAPRVSPGKTWEGVIGGFVAALAMATVGAFWFEQPFSRFLGLCTAVIAASIVGDLTESMFKRHVGLKDSSNLLPGHGGILDRIDSVTAAAPVFALGMLWLGVL